MSEWQRTEAAEELRSRFTSGSRVKSRVRRAILTTAWSVGNIVIGAAKRAFDFSVALLLLLMSSPVWIVMLLTGGIRLARTVRMGRWAEPFDEFSFAWQGPGGLLKKPRWQGLPVLLNILRGDMSFIGPRAVRPGELSPRDRVARRRYDVRPGLLCLWWVRQRANIAYDHETLSDTEYVESQSLLGDIALTLRAIPTALYGQSAGAAPEQFTLAGIRVHNPTMLEAVETLAAWSQGAEPRQVAFVNADCANIAWNNPEYASVLNRADLTLGDGIGLKLAAKAFGLQLKQNVNGTDMFPRLCEAMQGLPGGLFLLGARPGITEAVAAWVADRYPRVKLAGHRNGYFTPEEEPAVIEQIRASGATILLVALGAPRQDVWINQHLAATGVKVAMGVGGLFDFYSGRISRAPQWLREMGLEWTYRLYQEPGRMWRRYLVGNFVFFYHIALERRARRRKASV